MHAISPPLSPSHLTTDSFLHFVPLPHVAGLECVAGVSVDIVFFSDATNQTSFMEILLHHCDLFYFKSIIIQSFAI